MVVIFFHPVCSKCFAFGSRTCSNSMDFLPETARRPLKNMMMECPNSGPLGRLAAKHFKPCDPQHMHTLADMGISILTLADGRVQLLQTLSMVLYNRSSNVIGI